MKYCIPKNSRKDSDECLWYAVDQVINILNLSILTGKHKLSWIQNKPHLFTTNDKLYVVILVLILWQSSQKNQFHITHSLMFSSPHYTKLITQLPNVSFNFNQHDQQTPKLLTKTELLLIFSFDNRCKIATADKWLVYLKLQNRFKRHNDMIADCRLCNRVDCTCIKVTKSGMCLISLNKMITNIKSWKWNTSNVYNCKMACKTS